MRTTRAARAAVTFLPPTRNNADDDGLTNLWQDAFIEFLFGAAQHITKPSVVVLQTNDWKGLCQVTEQTPMDYAYTLLGCGIVTVNQSRAMHNKVEVHQHKLEEMLRMRNIMAYNEIDSYCHVSFGQVFEGALKEKRAEDAVPVSETGSAKTVTLRIGKIPNGGKAPPGPTAINSRANRPKFSWKIRAVHTRYHSKITPLVTKAYFDEKMREDAKIVAQWMVDPPQLWKRKYVNRADTKATKDATTSPPRKKVNTAATPKRDTGVKGAKDEEVLSQQLRDDLMAVFQKHGLLDKLKQQLPHEDLKQSPTTLLPTETSQLATTAAVTPSQALPLGEEETTADVSIDFTDPPQLNSRSPSESDKRQYPILSEVAPRVLQRDRECVGGMDMDQIYSEAILREIVKLKNAKGEDIGYESANSHSTHTLLDVPIVDKDNKKVPDMKSVLNQVMSMAEPGSEDIMVEAVIDYLVKSHNAATREVLRDRKITPRLMDEYDVAATMDEAELKSWQWDKIKQCLKLFLDIDNVSVARNKLQAISEGYGDITHGTYDYIDPKKPGRTTAEKIRFWWKDPVLETVASVTGLVNGYGLSPDDILFIHAVYGGDHGKNKFRFCGKVVIKTKDGKYYDDVFGLADVACKKDNGMVLDNTVMPHLVEGINVMEASGFVFHTMTDDDGS
eukprot:scaffold7282_cov81-Skeletonema_menzelii.AAC.1